MPLQPPLAACGEGPNKKLAAIACAADAVGQLKARGAITDDTVKRNIPNGAGAALAAVSELSAEEREGFKPAPAFPGAGQRFDNPKTLLNNAIQSVGHRRKVGLSGGPSCP